MNPHRPGDYALSAEGQSPDAFADLVLREARKAEASDVYWLPEADQFVVRFRIHGAPQAVAAVPREYGETCVSRLKVLGGLLTYRRQIAQDGVIRGAPAAGGAEIRISVMPTAFGERASLRFQLTASEIDLDGLGFLPPVTETIRDMLTPSGGMIVLTGPTGSGKTTTIYAMIRELLRRQHDPAAIITLEDPIERIVGGISQTAVSHESDWGYAMALRAALRQDVKTMVVGEMRDADIVRMTLDAALTGHRVITTYHAGDIPAVYARMLHQGFEPFLIASAVTGVVSQRLTPRADGTGSLPVVATLRVSDAWRDLVISNPSLSALRTAIRDYPGADLSAAADAVCAYHGLDDEEKHRLRTLVG